MKEKILKLRKLGYSYNKIVDELNCSKSLVSYYCGQGQQEKSLNRTRTRRIKNPLYYKIYQFMFNQKDFVLNKQLSVKIRNFCRNKELKYEKPTFTAKDVINKITKSPVCYLTGAPIDIYDKKSYQLDHIIPRSRGGDNSLDNLGIASAKANQAKRDMTPEEFLNLCKSVVAYLDK